MSSSIISGDSTINTDESTNNNSYDDGNNSNKATTKQIIPPPPIYYSSPSNKSSSISSPISISSSSQKSNSMSNTICCTIHPSIQLKRRRRRRTTATTNNNNTNDCNVSSNDNNEECWIQLIKECPLCTADDNDSVWSGRTNGSYLSRSSKSTSSRSSGSSSSNSNKTLRSSPKSSSKNDKKIYNSAPVNTPSPPPTAPRQLLRRSSTTTVTSNSSKKEYIPSKFKESKDNNEYDNKEDLSQIEQSSSSKSREYSNQDSQQENTIEEESINLNFPSLPFTDQDHHHDTTTATTVATATSNNSSSINERTSSIKQLIQCRKMKLEELKLRSSSNSSNSRLTPPSQRYMNSKLSIEEEDSLGEEEEQVVVDSSVKSSQRSLHSESTKCISNSATTVRNDIATTANATTSNVVVAKDTETKDNSNMLDTSFYSNVSHSCGSPQKDKLTLLPVLPNNQQEVVSNQKKLSRCHSDSTLFSSTVSNVKRDDQQHQHQQQQQQQSYYKKSILDISYDSFVDESVRQFFNYHTSTTNDEVSTNSSNDMTGDRSRVIKEEEKDNTATKEDEQVSCITLDVSNRSSDKEKNDHIDTTTTLEQQQVDSKKKSQQQSQPHCQQKHKVKRKAKSKDDLLNTATYDIWGSSNNNCMEVSQATTVTTTTDDVAADDNKELIQLSNKLYSLVYPRCTNTTENKNPRHPSVKQDTSSKKSMSNNMNDVNNDLQSMHIEEEVDVSMNVAPTLSSIQDNINMREEDADDDSYENENDGYSISEESLLGEEPPGYTSVNNKLKKYNDYNNEVSSSSYTQDDPPGDNMSSDSDYYTRSTRSPGVSTTSSSDSYSLGFDDYATNNQPTGGVSHYSMECSSDESRSRSSHLDERRRERSRDNHPNNPSILRNSISSKSRTSSTSKETSSRTDKETTSRRSNSTSGSSIAKSKSSSKSSCSSTVVTVESVKTFCQYDARTGRCIHHPHIQLRRKRRLGGFKKGQWKIISMNCTECAFEEVQRLRARALQKQQQQMKPCSSSVGQKSQYTSATETSSRYTSSDDSQSRDHRIPKGILKKHPSGYHYIDDSSTTNGSSISLPSISETQSYSTASSTSTPKGILKKPNKHVVYDNESSFLSGSTELSGLSESCYSDSTGSSSCVSSELTTEFSYLSSLSGSSCSTGSSDPYLSTNKNTRYPEGILRGSSRGSSRYSVSSRKSEGSRVVFAGRDIYY